MAKVSDSSKIGNNIESTIIRSVERNNSIKLNDAVLIAGFPGPGLVGSIGASYIIEQQKMHQIAYIDSDYVIPGVMYIGGRLRHPFRIYANNEGTGCVLVCDAPIIISGIRPLLNAVVSWIKSNGVREIIVLEGTPNQNLPEAGRKPLVLSSDGRSIDDHGYISHFQSKTEVNPPSFIVGVSGGLLAACLSNGIPCTGLLIPSISGIPDPEGASILIEKANELANNPFKIDARRLKNEALELKHQMQDLIDSVQRQKQYDQSAPGGGPGIYG